MQDEVRIRPAAHQFLALPFFAALVMVVAVAATRRVPWLLIALTALLMIPQVYGVKLTATHVEYLRLLGPKRVPWGSIVDIEMRPNDNPNIVIVHTLNSMDRLVAPRRGWVLRDRRFDDKLALLHRWWIAHRGPNWRPPADQQLPRRR